MSLSWITINTRLQNGVSIINSLSTSRFTLLLKHLVQPTHENIFTQEELKKLEDTLELNANNLQLLIQSILHIFKQSSKVILKPTILQKQLVENLKFESDKAEEFVKVWTNTTKEHFGNLENRLKLDNISWQLNLQSASSVNSKQAIPNVRLKLGLTSVQGTKQENIAFELNEEELLQMYTTLENIQNKLDFIQSSSK